jgi:AP-2 complex subunit alpha
MFLCRPAQECQKIFSARQPMDADAIRTRLMGFGLKPLVGVDPNIDNFVGAAIIHTRTAQIGVLLRLEPNRQAKVVVVDCWELDCN